MPREDDIVNVVLTPEQEEALHRYDVIEPDARFDYTPKLLQGLPPEACPVFKLREISQGTLQVQLRQAAVELVGENVHVNRGAFVNESVRLGLLGWENYYCSKSRKYVQWPGSSARAVAMLPADLITELSAAILGHGRMSEEEKRGLS